MTNHQLNMYDPILKPVIAGKKPSKPFLQFTEQDIIDIALNVGSKSPHFNRKQFHFAVCHRFSINLFGYGITTNPRFAAKPTKRQHRVVKRNARKYRNRLIAKFGGQVA